MRKAFLLPLLLVLPACSSLTARDEIRVDKDSAVQGNAVQPPAPTPAAQQPGALPPQAGAQPQRPSPQLRQLQAGKKRGTG